jgi:hypothetical protein
LKGGEYVLDHFADVSHRHGIVPDIGGRDFSGE